MSTDSEPQEKEQEESGQSARSQVGESASDGPADAGDPPLTTEAFQTMGQEELTNGDGSIPKHPENIDRILSIKVPLIAKVAEKKMTMDRILKLKLGSMIQFDKDAYQLIELMVKNCTIGLGQPAKLGENFGLKITHIGDIADTIRSLGKK